VEQTDVLLIEHFLEGNIDALATLFEKYNRMVYRVAIKITKNHEDADDVVQETFLKVYKSINTFRKKSSFETWLYRIVVNLSLNVVKRRKRRRESPIDQVFGNGTTNDVDSETEICSSWIARSTTQASVASSARSLNAVHYDEPHIRVERKELRRAVTQAVDSLPTKQKVVVVLHEFEGLTHPEIASILKCSVGTVRSRLHYARKRLRNLLTPYILSD